jgi:hypothetical protein
MIRWPVVLNRIEDGAKAHFVLALLPAGLALMRIWPLSRASLLKTVIFQ